MHMHMRAHAYAYARAQVQLFSVDSTDESNVALFHPHPHACAELGFLYATKDGRIRAFKFDRSTTSLPELGL